MKWLYASRLPGCQCLAVKLRCFPQYKFPSPSDSSRSIDPCSDLSGNHSTGSQSFLSTTASWRVPYFHFSRCRTSYGSHFFPSVPSGSHGMFRVFTSSLDKSSLTCGCCLGRRRLVGEKKREEEENEERAEGGEKRKRRTAGSDRAFHFLLIWQLIYRISFF